MACVRAYADFRVLLGSHLQTEESLRRLERKRQTLGRLLIVRRALSPLAAAMTRSDRSCSGRTQYEARWEGGQKGEAGQEGRVN